MKYLTLYHHNSKAKTLADFMEVNYIYTNVISVDDLFEYNRKLIFSQMSLEQKAEYAKSLGKKEITESDLKTDMVLPCPCTLKIEAKLVTYELAISQTNFQTNLEDLYAFANEAIQNIIQNEGYIIDRSTKKLVPTCSVYGWFKSLYYAGNLNDTKSFYRSNNNKFINISKFIINVATNVSASGGTFSITLPIINSIQDLVEVETKMQENNKKLSYIDRVASQKDVYKFGEFFFHKGGMISMEHNYFNWLIQSNDLLFISFEDLEMEKANGSKVFDMIGLVENVSVNQNANGQGSVTVTGKDLMKLITDDNSLFFNTSTVWGESQIFANTESMGKQGDIRDADMKGGTYNSPINRLRRSTNQIDVFIAPINRSLDFILKGVISQLANIEVVPDYVFEDWGDRRTKYAELYPEVTSNTSGTAVGANGNNGGGSSNQNKKNEAFSSGIEQNTNRDKYAPIGGKNPAKPKVPVLNEGYVIKDGIHIELPKLR